MTRTAHALRLRAARSAAATAVLAVAAFLSGASALAPQERFTPHHVAKLRVVSQVAVSPDGSQIAYVVAVPRVPLEDEDGPAWAELHVAGADGVTRPFVAGEVNVANVRWAPDGRRIAFVSRRGEDRTRSIHAIPADGGEAQRLVTFETDITDFHWAPDGKQVAFLAREPRPKEQQELARKGFNQEIFEEDTRPVRVAVAAVGDGEEEAAAPRLLDLPGSALLASWSPDGSRLAVTLAPTALVDDDLMRRRVHIVDAASGRVLARLDNEGKLDEVKWSPDGRYLALVSAEDVHDPWPGRLVVAPAAGGPLVDILPGYEAHVRSIGWRDADTLYFLGDEGVQTTFNELRRDGTGRRVIVPADGPVLTAFDHAPDGTVAFVAQTPQHPSEVYRLGRGAREATRVTDSNPWLADMRLAPQEVVRFQARDGLDLEGILIRPLDERPGGRHPLILYVHGGPEAHDRNGWLTGYSMAGQVGAAQGFAVFYPNYRGSTGRGVAFSKLGQGDPAGKEFDDLVDAVDHLIETGLVDRDQVGITGGSYGGYASAWGATYYTDRFAAAVMFVGISNKISKTGTTDIADEEYLVHARKRPWDDWQFFLERSPIYHAEKSRTPTLILHGRADPRVHPGQSLEMYRYLKLHGNTPVRLVWYPGEQHGNRRAASRLDYNLRLMRWMTHYLQGPGGEPPPYALEYAPAATPAPEVTAQ